MMTAFFFRINLLLRQYIIVALTIIFALTSKDMISQLHFLFFLTFKTHSLYDFEQFANQHNSLISRSIIFIFLILCMYFFFIGEIKKLYNVFAVLDYSVFLVSLLNILIALYDVILWILLALFDNLF
jgi:hypothetical protein